jgi:hypothetical protein
MNGRDAAECGTQLRGCLSEDHSNRYEKKHGGIIYSILLIARIISYSEEA